MKQLGRLAVIGLLVATGFVSGCAGHSERSKQGVEWVMWEYQQTRDLAKQGFSGGGRE